MKGRADDVMAACDSGTEGATSSYSLILEGPESTVCAKAPAMPHTSTAYQSEAQLEDTLITQLCDQGYERVAPKSEAELIANRSEERRVGKECRL